MVARVAPSLFPWGWARDSNTIPPWGNLVNLEAVKTPLQFIRHAVVLIAGILAGDRVVEAFKAWQEWRGWRATDPSGADAYRSFFLVNSAAALLSLCLAALLWHLLRPRQRKAAP
jgi:hypothetical protein